MCVSGVRPVRVIRVTAGERLGSGLKRTVDAPDVRLRLLADEPHDRADEQPGERLGPGEIRASLVEELDDERVFPIERPRGEEVADPPEPPAVGDEYPRSERGRPAGLGSGRDAEPLADAGPALDPGAGIPLGVRPEVGQGRP